ncbi:hypothetical protein AXF42_Ash000066 [Apostasia shenzhenica]|uniref:DUF4378 domain-containing protein n=1 Tax=Apostasia shenzhenica TaxID=1088818 RepID=A0A2I0AFB6_9ASPA|nr:hypothetical protein AXF42_Ash000066 [Apostasia shenzhenica]
MVEQLRHNHGVPGCMKGLAHFLDLNHRVHLRKMKMLAYRRHVEGKREARNKTSKTETDAPSEFTDDVCSVVEDKVDETRKHSGKSFMKLSISKWRLRDHNKKRKTSPTASSLGKCDDQKVDLNSGKETLSNEQIAEGNHATTSREEVPIYASQFVEHGIFHISDSFSFENDLPITPPHLSNRFNGIQPDSLMPKINVVEERQGDVPSNPSKEFLAMMNLFDGKVELIQKILEDPTFIFAHYLQGQQASIAELRRICSFPASGILERMNNGLYEPKHKRIESDSLVKKINDCHPEKTPSHSYTSDADILKIEAVNSVGNSSQKEELRAIENGESSTSCHVVVPTSVLQNEKEKPPVSSRFKFIKQKIKDVIREHKREHHISMDGILHKIPYGRNLPHNMKKKKLDAEEESALDKLDEVGSGFGFRNKSSEYFQKTMKRSQSLTDSIDKYTRLIESISSGDPKRSPEKRKLIKEGDRSAFEMAGKTLGRIFSLPDIRYGYSQKDASNEAPFFPLSPLNFITVLKEEGSRENTLNGEGTLRECKISDPSDEQEQEEQFNTSNDINTKGQLPEGSSYVPPQKEVHTNEDHPKTRPTYMVGSFYPEDDYLGLVDYPSYEVSEVNYQLDELSQLDANAADGLRNNEREANDFIPVNLQVDQKDEAEFNYVREILKKSGFSGHDCLGAWRFPYQPMDPLKYDEAESLPYELDIAEDEHNISPHHQLLFDLINEALVDIYESSYSYLFPWLSPLNTHTRPLPMENHILEEVWGNIYRHLHGQPQLELSLGEIKARDFTKNHGWMTLLFDSEDVELEVEDQILDELIDDIIVQLMDLRV